MRETAQREAYCGLATTGQPQDLRVASDLTLRGRKMRSNMGIVRREKSENYSVVYNECFQNPQISARAKGLFAYLMTLPDDWKIYKRELHKHFREGRDAMNKAFDELEKAGYITKQPERNEDGTLSGWDYTVYESTDLLKTRITDNPSNGKPVTTNNLLEESTNQTNSGEVDLSAQSKKTEGAQVCAAAFSQFWVIYPRKVGKGAAEKAFAKALKKVDLETLLKSVEDHRQSNDWAKDGGQYIPHPATFLNQERWLDEIQTKPNGPSVWI